MRKTMTLKELKKGEYFTRKDIEFPKDTQVFVRGDYDRSTKKYECHRFSDINDTIYLKGSTNVFTDMTF